jgi:hypothetical protein
MVVVLLLLYREGIVPLLPICPELVLAAQVRLRLVRDVILGPRGLLGQNADFPVVEHFDAIVAHGLFLEIGGAFDLFLHP